MDPGLQGEPLSVSDFRKVLELGGEFTQQEIDEAVRDYQEGIEGYPEEDR